MSGVRTCHANELVEEMSSNDAFSDTHGAPKPVPAQDEETSMSISRQGNTSTLEPWTYRGMICKHLNMLLHDIQKESRYCRQLATIRRQSSLKHIHDT